METKKEDRRIGKTKESIRSAFLSLLIEKEINQITVKELSDRANINRKTFYMYYSNINDILDKIENEIIDKLIDLLKDCEFFSKNFDVYEFFRSLNEVITEDFELYHHLVYAHSHTMFFVKVKEIIKSSILDHYSDSIPVSHDTFRLYAEYAASAIIAIYIEWFTIDSKMTLEELAKTAADITLQGFGPLIK